jgi:hypothetical protein
MIILKNLGFKPFGKLKQNWYWRNLYTILTKAPNENNIHGKSKIIKNLNTNFTGDKRETLLFQANTTYQKCGLTSKHLQ